MSDNPLISQQGQFFFNLTSGAASGGVTFLPGGSYNIWGSYSGDGTFAPSVSTKIPITVTPEASTLALQVTENLNGQSSNLSGQQVPYGTPAILNGIRFRPLTTIALPIATPRCLPLARCHLPTTAAH